MTYNKRAEIFLKPIAGSSLARSLKLLSRMARFSPSMAIMTTLSTIALGLTEGIGLGMLLPILSLVGVEGGASASQVSELLATLMESLNLPVTLITLLALFVIAGLLQIGFQTLQRIQVINARETLQLFLRTTLFDAASSASWTHLSGERGGHFINAVATETTRIISVIGYAITIFGLVILLVVYLAMAAWISWEFTLFLVAVGSVTTLSLWPLFRSSQRYGTGTYLASNRMQEVLNEHVTATRKIRAMNAGSWSRNLFADAAREVMRFQLRVQYNLPFVRAQVEPIGLLLVAIIVYAGIEYVRLSAGELVTLLVVFYRIVPRVVALQQMTQRIFAMIPSFDYLSELNTRLSAAREMSGSKPFVDLQDSIEIRAARLSADGKTILDDINIRIPANSTVALIGPSGGGKTTVLDLLLGLKRPDSGEIFYDGTPLAEIDLASLRNHTGVVFQETNLFHDTIRNNMRLADMDADDDRIWNALERAHAADFVRARPEGLDAEIGDQGIKLSGGQRQRLGLAQALLRQPQLLILDEPTSALDPDSEAAIRDTLAKLRHECTIVVVSHRDTLTVDADVVFRVESGRIVATSNGGDVVSAVS